jgi:hypothetical protein
VTAYGAAMASDAEAVTRAIREAALCLMCIARKLGTAPMSVISALADIGQRETITERLTCCDDCFKVRHTHTLKPLPPA